jgi:hypothetical protein
MKNLLLFLSVCLAIIGCKDSEKSVPAYEFNAFNVDFMNYYFMRGVTGDTNRVLLEYYEDGRLKRRIGDIVSVPVPPYPYPWAFSPDVVDSFTYVQNQVHVDRYFRYEGDMLPVYSKTYTIDNGKLTQVTTEQYQDNTTTDTTTFLYNSEGLLDTSITYGYRDDYCILILTKVYLFDSSGNLIQVKGISQTDYTTEENFSGYDQSENPLKNLIGLEDVFYRSLSKNNFTDYSFYRSPNIWNERHWDFEYDDNGLPLFLRN